MAKGDLTPKEIEALALIAQGHDAKSAALELSVSSQTIYERLRRAREKLGAANSRAAARMFFGANASGNEKLLIENLVLADVCPVDAFLSASHAAEVVEAGDLPLATSSTKPRSSWLSAPAYLPLRSRGERDLRATKVERLRLIGELSARLAMAFVAICLAAMVLSTILQRT